MINLLLRSRTLRALLRLFLFHPADRFYAREIERRTREPMGALQRQLARLEGEKFLRSEQVGPLKYYALNPDYPCLQEFQTLVLREFRHRELQKNLKKILGLLTRYYHPEKVFLFGSLATGKISPDSDLDLLIIKRGIPKRYGDRVKELAPLIAKCDVGLDYLIWTPSEWMRKSRDSLFTQEEIFRKGKIVYDRAA